jgi:hypothetical protein
MMTRRPLLALVAATVCVAFAAVGGGKDLNVPEPFIANLDENASHTPAYSVKVSAQQDGSFSVTNARNGFTKAYRARR